MYSTRHTSRQYISASRRVALALERKASFHSPSYLSSLAATHRFVSLSRIFCPSASPSPHLKPPGDANRTAQYSTADATSARLVDSPISCVMHVALDTSPSDSSPRL